MLPHKLQYSCCCCCCCCCCLLWHLQVRDPVAGVFSAETMLRGMGVPLTWTLAQPGTGAAAAVGAAGEQQQQQDLEEGGDPRFRVREAASASRLLTQPVLSPDGVRLHSALVPSAHPGWQQLLSLPLPRPHPVTH